MPVLLGVGLPPQVALGTNKLQASFGSFTAAYHYTREQVVQPREARFGIACTAVGAALGTWSVQQIDPGALELAIPLLLIVIAVYMLFTPRVGETPGLPRLSRGPFYALFGTTLGFYDGFFGPGVGSFWAFALMLGLGYGLTQATGYTKIMNFTSNLLSLCVFTLGGRVVWTAGLVMAVGQIVGARIGSGLVVRRGARFIKPIYLGVVLLTTAKLLYSRLL